MNSVRENSNAETYAILWKMTNETDGDAVCHFENGTPVAVVPISTQPQRAKLHKQ